ncbi:MAG: hypothetical protein IJ848_00005, partial [Alphaproteobacteria bacterium]|nr:hypothetical protein [Alphaproteobacteria bacterium]
TNYSTGKVNVTNTITLTNDNPGQTAQFKAVPSEAESVQVYKDTQANNINITGDYEVQDITEQQQLQSNEIKTAIENNSNETINDHPDSAIQNLRALNVNNNIESENDNIQNQNNNVRTNNILLRAGNINSNLDSENNNNSNTNNQQNDDNNAVARENNVILRAGNRAENSNNNVPIQQEEENNNELLREDNNTNLENNINNDTNNNNVINNENGIIPTIITETNNNQLQNYYGESFAIINNQQNYNIIHRITCNIKSNNDNNNDWKLESDHFNNDNFNESIYVQLNINGSDNNYKDINVPYVKYENFLTTDKGKQVYLVNNAPIETNNGTYRFVTNKKDLYLIKVTDSNKTQLGQAINDNGGYIDNGTLNTVLRGNNNNLNNNKNSNNNQNNDEKDADENEDPILYGFSGFRSSKPNNSEGEDDENNPNIFGSARPNNSDDEESTDSDYILGDSSNGALSVLLSNYLSPEDSNESSSQKSKLKSLKRKLIKNPASELSTYCANLKSMEYNNIDLMSQLFYDDFMYIFSPFSASKKAYFIRGELSGVNNSLWNSNNIFIGGDIFNDAILDCNSRLKLSLIGNTSFGKLTNNSYKYKFLEFNIGPKLSILSRDFVFELLGLYRYSNVSYIGDSSNQFVNSGFSIGSKLGVNINLSNIFVLQPYIKILYSNMTSYKPRKDLPSNYQINIVPGISLGLKLRNNFSIIAYYQHYYKSLLQDKNGLDLTDPSLNYINEFGIGLNKIFNNSVELSTKIAIDIINRLYNSKTKNDGSVKLQAQVSKLL